MKSFQAFVAGRYLRAERKQSFIAVISVITLIGITLGVAALNVALSVHNGMRRAFVESLIGRTGELHIMAGSLSGGFDSAELGQLGQVLATIPGVAATAPMIQEHGVIFSERRQLRYGKLIGIVPEDFLRASDTLDQLEQGHIGRLEDRPTDAPPGIILGTDLARNLGARRGDFVQVAVPRISAPGLSRQGLRLREMKCEVVGIFRTGNSQFDSVDAYLLLDDLMLLLNTRKVQTLLVRFDDVAALDRGKAQLIGHPDLPTFATVVDLRDFNQNLLKALRLEKAATTLVIGLFILIVGLNMISALIMMVMEKHRDIGIMRSFGTPRKTIARIFVRQGMTLAVAGTCLGTVLGVAAAWVCDHYRLIQMDNRVYEVLSYLPFEVQPLEVLWIACGSLVLAYLASLYPARRAAALDPVQALKYD